MNKKKIDLDNIEELIKIATTEEEIISPRVNNDIITFFNYFNIKPGKFKIKNEILYSIYRHWSKDPKERIPFISFVNKILEKDSRQNNFISVESIKLHQNLYEFLNKNLKPVKKVRNFKNHFESFLNYYNFKSGDFFVKESSMYYLYDKWTYENKNKNPIGEITLLKFCNMYLPTKTVKENNKIIKYLGINKEIMKATLEQLEFASKWNEIRYEKRQKRIKKK